MSINLPGPSPGGPELDPTNRVQIFDTTLRDGEQSPGIALDIDEKVAIARQLGRMGVDVIEAGFPINSRPEFEAVQKIAQEIEGPAITALARAHKGDIDRAGEAIKDAERPRIHTFISTSDIHIINQLRTDREDVKGQAKAAVAHAKTLVDDVEFSPMDATRADWDYTAEVVQLAVNEGATVINIPDTVGYTTPDEYREFFEFLRREVKGSENVIWSAHCHDDLDLSTANAWAAILGGARQVEGSINGIGERAGNTQLSALIMLLKTRGNDFGGLHTGITTEELGPTARMVSRYTGYAIPRNQPVDGANAFAHESGIHVDGIQKARETYEIMDPASVGWEGEQIVIGKHTGRAGVIEFLEKLPSYSKEAAAKTWDLFKKFRDAKTTVTAEQLIEIHDEAQRRLKAGYEIEEYSIAASEGNKNAHVRLIDQKTNGVTDASAEEDPRQVEIDGSVAALISAIAKATHTNYKVKNVEHSSVGEGKSSIDKAVVEIRINGKTVRGMGLSTDTVKAAGLAYIDAVRRAQERKG